MSLRSSWNDYFTFNRKERNGAFLIFTICCVLTCLLGFYRFYFQPAMLRPDKKFLTEAAAFEERLALAASVNEKTDSLKKLPFVTEALFAFNPNELNDSTAKSLGVPAYLSSRIINYVNKGGRFRIKKDLLKIYGMDTSLYVRLEPYINLPDSLPLKENVKYKNSEEIKPGKETERPLEIYDLNKCSSTDLIRLKGIGEIRASKILYYRFKLGGFTHVEQLLEIGGIDSMVFGQIKNQLIVNTPLFRKISLKDFKCSQVYHPYLKKELCREIEKKLFLNPHLKSLEELRSLPSMNDSIWQKLSPYLTIN